MSKMYLVSCLNSTIITIFIEKRVCEVLRHLLFTRVLLSSKYCLLLQKVCCPVADPTHD